MANLIPQITNVPIIKFFKWYNRAKTFVLPAEVSVNGAVEASIPGRIEGNVNGDVRSSGTVIIGEQAQIRGHVYASDVIVHGRVYGDIYASNKAVITDKARIKGDVTAMIMEIREGALVEGAIRKNIITPSATTPTPTPAVDESEKNEQANAWF